MRDLDSDHLRAALPRAEQRHRRRVLVGIGVLIALSTSPIFGHHIAGAAAPLLAGRDHLLNLCLVALHELLAPVHEASHVVFIAGVLYAVADRLLALWRSRETLSMFATSVAMDDRLRAASHDAGIPDRVSVVPGSPVPAFTAGLLKPRVYVSGDLVDRLDRAELVSVLAHEAAHVRRRDPLRLTCLRFLAALLFYVPVLRRLAEDAADEAEILADDHASSDPVSLASAIVKLSSPASGKLSPALIGFQRAELTERRVRRLLGCETAIGTHVTPRSMAGAFVLLTVVWVSGALMIHPLPAAQSTHARMGETHCQHKHLPPWAHVFCRGLRPSAGSLPCPHSHR